MFLDDSPNAFSLNCSDAAEEDVEPESCDESPIEDAALSTGGFHLHKCTLNSLANKIQTPVMDYERMQLSGRQSSKEKILTLRHNLSAFDDSVACAKNEDNSSRKRRASQEQLQTNSEDSPKKPRNSFEIGILSSSSLITGREGVNTGILNTRIKLPPPSESTACAKDADERTGSVLKGSAYISVNEDLRLKDTLVDTTKRRGLDELFSEITQDSRVKTKTNACADQTCCDYGNNRVTSHATTDSIASRNHAKQWQISEGKYNKKLTNMVKKDGHLLPLSSLDLVGERHMLRDSGSNKCAEHEAIKLARKNEHLGNQSNFGLDNDDCIASGACSRIQSFNDIKSCGKIKKFKTNGDLMHESRSDLVDEDDSLLEPRSRNHDTSLKFSKMKTSNNLKLKVIEINKGNSNPLSINCTKEDCVLSTIERTRSISPECKSKSACKSTLDYSYGCNLCGLKFCDMESLRCHMPCVNPLKCGVCSKTFRESVALERHLQGLRTNKIFKCEICSKNCTSKSCLAWHMQTHIDIEPENCENQSNTLLSKASQASLKSSECTICSKKFFSQRCLQSHMKLHKGNEPELLSRVSDDCQPENLVIPEESSGSKEPSNRSFRDALDINKLFTADLVSKRAELQEENSLRHCDHERSSWSIFDQNRLFCDSGSSLPIDLEQKEARNRQQNGSNSVSIFDHMSSVIASGQKLSTELICAQEISSEIKKTYRPYCVKCWDTFKDLLSLEEHAKFCNESCRKSSPIATIPVHLNECIITMLEDRPQSSECVMENISEEIDVKSVEAVTDNCSADVVKCNTANPFEELMISSDTRDISNLHDSVHERVKGSLDEVPNCESQDWAKNSLDGLTREEPNDLASMLHVLAKNAGVDQANSESDYLAESFSEEKANIESYMANSESDLLDMNGSDKVANGKSDDLTENVSDDLSKNGSDESFEDTSRLVTKSVLGKVTEQPSNLVSSGSDEFLESCSIDSTISRSDGVANDSSRIVNFLKCGSQTLTKSVLHEVSNCLSDDDALHCLECHKIFSNYQNLNNHMELHKLFGSSLHCNRCKHQFTFRDTIQEHTCQAYTVEGPQFRCPECRESFEISQQLKKHMSEVHSLERNFKCKQCGRQYEMFCKWNTHVQTHRSDRHYVCNKCGKRYKFLDHLKREHLPCFSNFAELKCPKCNEEFVMASQLRNHMTHCQNVHAVKCLVCHQLLSSQSKLDKHMHRHTADKPYQCPQCEKSFVCRSGLLSHTRSHSAKKRYVCDVCSKAFTAKRVLLKHYKIHLNVKEKCSLGNETNGASNQVQKKETSQQMQKHLYGCGLCGCLYMGLRSLKRHLPCAGVAGEKDPFFCGECNEKFFDENELQKHVASVHSENLFSCSICSKMFVKERYLKMHMHSHTGKYPFKCKQCCKHFKNVLHLKYHLPCYVSPGSDIQCNQCQKTFFKIAQLRTHINIDHSRQAKQCNVCGKKFLYRHSLDVHLKNHENDRKKPYYCTRCSTGFGHISSWKRHLETFHLNPLKDDAENESDNSKYQHDAYLNSQISLSTAGTDDTLDCLNCFKTFRSHQQLNIHLELHRQFGNSLRCSHCKQKFTHLDLIEGHTCEAYTIEGQFGCPECEENFKINKQLKRHMSEVHSVERNFRCKHCSSQYETFGQWNQHLQVHRIERPYVCNKCGKRFKFLHNLKTSHLPCLSDSTELKCPKCNEVFIKAAQLRIHMKLCQNERAVKCLVCQRLFQHQGQLDKHMRSHTREKPYQCPQCDKCFSFRLGLTNHLLCHSGVKPYICDVCGKAFAAETFLRNHSKIHTTDRPYKCSECDMSFSCARFLRIHKARAHTAVKNRFACVICNKSFFSKVYLKEHMCSHTGQNPYLCSICGKGFPGKQLLKYHLRVHTGEKPYACKHCYRRFSMPRSMRNHERVHTGEKPYECTICGMKFSQSSYLKNHSKKAHTAE